MKTTKSFKLIWVVLLLVVFVVSFGKTQNSQAVSSSGPTLTISPIDFKFNIDPGKSQTDQIRLTNNGDTKLSVQSAAEDFLQQDEDGTPGFIPLASEQTTLAKWITVGITDFTISPQETKTIPFTIAVPQNGEPGGHYAAIFFKTVPPQTIGGTQIGLSNQIGSLVLVQVSGNITKTGKIVETQVPKFVNHGPVNLVVRFEDTGNTHYDTQGDIKIYNWFGKNTEELDLPTHTILPNSIRKFATTFSQKWLVGKYTVKAEIKDGDGNLQTNETTFFAFPWQEALMVLGALIIVIAIIIAVRKKKNISSQKPGLNSAPPTPPTPPTSTPISTLPPTPPAQTPQTPMS
jgi:hypothetical protein